jgi:hypothetical protein
LEEAKSFVKHRLPEIDSQWAARAVVIIDASVSGWAAEEDAARSDDAKFDASMSPTDYERFCADRFAAAGWKVRLTKGSGDQGADIVCEATGRRLVVQCKLYSGSVGNSAVQEVIAAREFVPIRPRWFQTHPTRTRHGNWLRRPEPIFYIMMKYRSWM